MKNKMLWVLLLGVAFGVLLSANVPMVPEQVYAWQSQLIQVDGSFDFNVDYAGGGSW